MKNTAWTVGCRRPDGTGSFAGDSRGMRMRPFAAAAPITAGPNGYTVQAPSPFASSHPT